MVTDRVNTTQNGKLLTLTHQIVMKYIFMVPRIKMILNNLFFIWSEVENDNVHGS